MAIPKSTGKFDNSDSSPIAKCGESYGGKGTDSVRGWMQTPPKGKGKKIRKKHRPYMSSEG